MCMRIKKRRVSVVGVRIKRKKGVRVVVCEYNGSEVDV